MLSFLPLYLRYVATGRVKGEGGGKEEEVSSSGVAFHAGEVMKKMMGLRVRGEHIIGGH